MLSEPSEKLCSGSWAMACGEYESELSGVQYPEEGLCESELGGYCNVSDRTKSCSSCLGEKQGLEEEA